MNAKHLPPAIEVALDRFASTLRQAVIESVSAAGESTPEVERAEDLVQRAERKLRRAIFANLSSDAITEEFEYRVGEEVVWLVTEGSGNEYTPNEKRPLRCRVEKVGKRGVQVQPIEGWRARELRPSWVQRRSLLPVKHRLAKKLLAERRYVI